MQFPAQETLCCLLQAGKQYKGKNHPISPLLLGCFLEEFTSATVRADITQVGFESGTVRLLYGLGLVLVLPLSH